MLGLLTIGSTRERSTWSRDNDQYVNPLFDPELYALVPDGVVTVTGKFTLAPVPTGLHARIVELFRTWTAVAVCDV
jgi:hypothetical protein